MQKVHFITGLPRSGSTLLGGILRQNPRFHAAMTSPVGGVVKAVLGAMGPGNEFSTFLSETQKERLLGKVFEGYYEEFPEAEVVFDTNRLWSALLPLTGALYPDSKVIATVRNPAWVMDSIERLVRKNAFDQSRIFSNAGERATVYSRSETLIQRNRLIGYAWSALKEAYYSDEADRLLLVEYDLLCKRPAETTDLIYRFIDEKPFAHDFDNVEYKAGEFDAMMNTPGLHTLKRKVKFSPRRSVLPPDIFKKFAALVFWTDKRGNKANRIVNETAKKNGNGSGKIKSEIESA